MADKIKVKMRTVFAHPDHGTAHPDQHIELPADEAHKLVRERFAVYTDEADAPLETAEAEPAENATASSSKPAPGRRGRKKADSTSGTEGTSSSTDGDDAGNGDGDDQGDDSNAS